MVKFGDVVRQCKKKVDRDNNPFERYVEGGHMDTEDIHIRRWGEFGKDYVGPVKSPLLGPPQSRDSRRI
jgi:type I restriction enzyme S subunit